jgi:hypothetical protein
MILSMMPAYFRFQQALRFVPHHCRNSRSNTGGRNPRFGLSCGGYRAQEQIWLRGVRERCMSGGDGAIHPVDKIIGLLRVNAFGLWSKNE